MPRCPTLLFVQQSRAADEVLFVQVDQFAQADLRRRILLLCDERLFAADVIHLDQDESSFDASHVQRQHAGGMQVEALASIGECIPDLHRLFPGNPDLVAEVSGIARTRDIDGNTGNGSVGHAEVFQVLDFGLGHGFE